MNQENKGSTTTKATPKKYRYSNDYIASCALFLIDGKKEDGKQNDTNDKLGATK